MSDRMNTETRPSTECTGSAQHQQMEARNNREFSVQTWYASPVAQRGGLETGARGWRWAPPAGLNESAEQRH